MAQIESSGRGRNTHVELNLVPFIDLMSVLITFLLISAVWTQVSMIQLGASFAAPRSDNQQEIVVPPNEDMVLRLDVVEAGYVLMVGKQTLVAELQKVKQRFPDKPGVKISIADEIIYDHVVKAMDAGLQAGFAPELLTGGPK